MQGTHKIDFEVSPLSDTGIFLLTGPTGAGKTSILDAIVVGLYGRVPRLNNNYDVSEIMSRGTAECWSEVEFESASHRYRSKWMVHRSRKKPDGVFQSKSMEISELPSGKPIETLISKVPTEVERITGLSCEQFLRSMMLAQGDFSAFLKAKDKERAELLDKMVGTSIYSDISITAYEKAAMESRKVKELEAKIDTTRLLSGEEKFVLTVNQEENRKIIKQTALKLEQLRTAKEWRRIILELTNEIHSANVNAESLQQEKSASTADFLRLSLHKRTLEVMPALKQYEDMHNEAARINSELELLSVQLPNLNEVVNIREAEKITAQITRNTAQTIIEENSPTIEKAILLDDQIKHILEKFPKLRALELVALQQEVDTQNQLKSTHKTLEEAKVSDYIVVAFAFENSNLSASELAFACTRGIRAHKAKVFSATVDWLATTMSAAAPTMLTLPEFTVLAIALPPRVLNVVIDLPNSA